MKLRKLTLTASILFNVPIFAALSDHDKKVNGHIMALVNTMATKKATGTRGDFIELTENYLSPFGLFGPDQDNMKVNIDPTDSKSEKLTLTSMDRLKIGKELCSEIFYPSINRIGFIWDDAGVKGFKPEEQCAVNSVVSSCLNYIQDEAKIGYLNRNISEVSSPVAVECPSRAMIVDSQISNKVHLLGKLKETGSVDEEEMKQKYQVRGQELMKICEILVKGYRVTTGDVFINDKEQVTRSPDKGLEGIAYSCMGANFVDAQSLRRFMEGQVFRNEDQKGQMAILAKGSLSSSVLSYIKERLILAPEDQGVCYLAPYIAVKESDDFAENCANAHLFAAKDANKTNICRDLAATFRNTNHYAKIAGSLNSGLCKDDRLLIIPDTAPADSHKNSSR